MNKHRPAYKCEAIECDTKVSFEEAHATQAPPCHPDRHWEAIPAIQSESEYLCSICNRAGRGVIALVPPLCHPDACWITHEQARTEQYLIQENERKIDLENAARETTEWGDEVITTKSGAKRANSGKIRWDLMPVVAMRDTAQIWTFGAEKYGDRNWEKGFDWSGPFASMMRHLQAWWAGEDFDPESGLSHLAHAACNLQMLQHFEYHYREGDNRPAGSCPPIRKQEEDT